MQDLKMIVAQNIAELRKASAMTQIELAARLNYSDTAVSKWERGESIPDVTVLKGIADLFGVTVDYLLTEEHAEASLVPARPAERESRGRRRLVITLLAAALVWLLATASFVILGLLAPQIPRLWIVFVYAVPVMMIVFLVFNSIWGNSRRNYLIISGLVWSAIASVYCSIPLEKMWLLFLLGIPAELIIILWSRIRN